MADRISSLPCDVLDIILGKLSIVEAVRMSVLAKAWRYNWLCLSKLKLYYCALAVMLNNLDIKWEKYTSIVSKYLLHHKADKGSIKVFHLQSFCTQHYSEVYTWIEYLSKFDVEDLLIKEFGNQQWFQMPVHLFMFKKLQSLFLGCCAVQIPSTFGSFNNLLKLSLIDVKISDEDLYHLILACPHMIKLKLLRMPWLGRLRIQSSRLTTLTIDTRMDDIFIETPAYLVSVCIKDALSYHRKIQNWQSIIRCLSTLNTLQNLVLYGDFIKILAADCDAFETFPLMSDTLTCVSLGDVRFATIEVFRVILSILRSCPNIKSFKFKIKGAKGAQLMTEFLDENKGLFSFQLLDSILVECPVGVGLGCSVDITEFLCAHSPNLKVLRIEKGGHQSMNTERVSGMISRFRKICPPLASIQYTTYSTD